MARPDLGEKDILNPEEAIRYWNFSRRKFYQFLEQTDGGDYLAYYKKRTLIIRLAFEQYLLKNPKVKEEYYQWQKQEEGRLDGIPNEGCCAPEKA